MKRGSSIDWSALKLDFYESDFLEIFPFLEDKFGKSSVNWNLRTKTKGRSKDKAQWLEKIREKALKKAEKKLENKRIPETERLVWLYKNAIWFLEERSNQQTNTSNNTIKKLNIKDIKEFISIIRLEYWLPTSVNKSENTDNNWDYEENLTYEEQELYDAFIRQKWKNENPKQSKK
jgi:hypothetical protein